MSKATSHPRSAFPNGEHELALACAALLGSSVPMSLCADRLTEDYQLAIEAILAGEDPCFEGKNSDCGKCIYVQRAGMKGTIFASSKGCNNPIPAERFAEVVHALAVAKTDVAQMGAWGESPRNIAHCISSLEEAANMIREMRRELMAELVKIWP